MQEGTEISSGHREETVEGAEDARGDLFAKDCPTRVVLDRISDKWTVLLLLTLKARPMRFNALKRQVDGVSQKMLSQTLRQMERDGLVTRTVEVRAPVSVVYGVTPLGETLVEALQPMIDWAETRMPLVVASQAAFDQRQAVI